MKCKKCNASKAYCSECKSKIVYETYPELLEILSEVAKHGHSLRSVLPDQLVERLFVSLSNAKGE